MKWAELSVVDSTGVSGCARRTASLWVHEPISCRARVPCHAVGGARTPDQGAAPSAVAGRARACARLPPGSKAQAEYNGCAAAPLAPAPVSPEAVLAAAPATCAACAAAMTPLLSVCCWHHARCRRSWSTRNAGFRELCGASPGTARLTTRCQAGASAALAVPQWFAACAAAAAAVDVSAAGCSAASAPV